MYIAIIVLFLQVILCWSLCFLQFKTPRNVAGSSAAIKIVKNTEIIEEVNLTPESKDLYNNEDEDEDDDGDDHNDDSEDEDDDDDDGSEPRPGEASIGKKIWKFLSTWSVHQCFLHVPGI